MNTVYLSLGSNTDAERNLREIVRRLRERLRVVAVSPVYASTDAAGGDAVYLNAAVVVETAYDAAALKTEVLRPLESALGRERGGAAVTADADIVLFNREVTSYLGRDLPDPDVTTRAHVALPLADIAPDYVHPVSGQTLAQIAAALRSPAIHRREDIRL